MENDTQLPGNNNPHDTYVGFALILLSVAGLDSKFDPETLAQLAELIVTVISGLIGVYIVMSGKKVKGDDGKTSEINTGAKQAAAPPNEQQANNELPDPIRTDSERGK